MAPCTKRGSDLSGSCSRSESCEGNLERRVRWNFASKITMTTDREILGGSDCVVSGFGEWMRLGRLSMLPYAGVDSS